MKKKVLAMSLAVILGCAQVMIVSADTIDDVKQQKAQTASQLEATQDKINTLESQKRQIAGEIDSLDAKLVETIAAINGLKENIADKEVEIEETKVQLQQAEEDRDKQYSDMKKRIQYLYENGGNGTWATALLEDGNLSDMLSSVRQTQELYDYDKKALEEYMTVVQQVTDLGNQLEEEKRDLQSMEAEQEAEQQSLEQMLEEKKATSADYDNQIAVANEKAAQYQELIEQQNAQIQELVAEQQRQAEEARRKAEREEAARQQAAQQSTESSSGNKTNTGGGSGTTNKGENKPSKGDSKPDSKPSKPDNSQSSPSGNSSGSASGQAVVNYATQFVGNPYVWGGTSLTNGADCSGFIMSVYAHFGYSLPHSSAALRSVGRGVSYAEAQPGDIICYEGHVAIYMGGGSIVHASNSAPYPQGGIKISGNAAYKTILAVRRIV